jgi:hypothetical protein
MVEEIVLAADAPIQFATNNVKEYVFPGINSWLGTVIGEEVEGCRPFR